MISKLSILGYRGFGEEQELQLAIPNGVVGSGLTTIVGPNNSGKSSIIESFKLICKRTHGTPSFTEGKRNKEAGDRVCIKLFYPNKEPLVLETVREGGSETQMSRVFQYGDESEAFVVSSRRTFNPYFGKSIYNRKSYLDNDPLPNQRGETNHSFQYRLFHILDKGLEDFNKILGQIINPVPQWTIDQSDSGSYYVKFNYGSSYHNSDGAGEGLLSIFTIVDALYDSNPGELIVIDEPELSLHPSLQRKLAQVLLEFSADRQIVIATHSPFFISWEALVNEGSLARVVKELEKTKIYQLPEDFKAVISGLTSNLNNPHILGLDAKEIFFLDDNINIVEGQEDLIFIKKIITHLQLELKGNFFGWGIGGATNLNNILKLLSNLGFKKVSCILDNNMKDLAEKAKKDYPQYHFCVIPTDDVRDKEAVPARAEMKGLIDRGGKNFKKEYTGEVTEIINSINKYYYA